MSRRGWFTALVDRLTRREQNTALNVPGNGNNSLTRSWIDNPSLKTILAWNERSSKRRDVLVSTVRNWCQHAPVHPGYANPFRLLMVDPNNIERIRKTSCEVYELCATDGFGTILAGDWRETGLTIPIESNTVVKALLQRFQHGVPWDETRYYQQIARRIEQGSKLPYESVEEFRDSRLSAVDALYRDIQRNGYQSNALRNNTVQDAYRGTFLDAFDVMVMIDRNGDFVVFEGKHRVAIAQSISDVYSIPVHVYAVHRDWQDTRDFVATHGETRHRGTIRDHPDLIALRSEPVYQNAEY